MISSPQRITVAIPTYRRENVLVDTLTAILALEDRPAEVLVLDQSERHDVRTDLALEQMADAGQIRWLRLAVPCIPQAMNIGLVQAANPLVLFLDDDIRPEPGLVAAHCAAHRSASDLLVAGKVLQPWDEGVDYSADTHFHFASGQPRWVREFMGGNFSIDRKRALQIGGFDENFVRVAYRFEAEFAHRLLGSGCKIFYEPAACVHHLKVAAGGTRSYGEHLTTWRPDHAVGAYYYGLRTGAFRKLLGRPLRSIATRHHLRHPWHIPGTLFAEFSALLWALGLFARGPRLVGYSPAHGTP